MFITTVDVHQHRYSICVDEDELESSIENTCAKYEGRLDTPQTRENMKKSLRTHVKNSLSIEPEYDENEV